MEVLGDETAPGRNSVSSLFVEVLGDDTGDTQSISTNFGSVELKAVYFGDVQISKIRHGNTSRRLQKLRQISRRRFTRFNARHD